jgi:hypothetical protein
MACSVTAKWVEFNTPVELHIRSQAAILSGMDSESIERHQAAQIRDTLRPMVGYLYRLRERMSQVGFLPSDPLFKRVDRAYDAMHALFVELHYLACEGGGKRLKAFPPADDG